MEEFTRPVLMPKTKSLQEDEYIGDNGLRYCKKCKTARQAFSSEGGFIYDKPCECMSVEIAKKATEREKKEKSMRIERFRLKAIPNNTYRNYRFYCDDGATIETTNMAKKYVDKFELFSQHGQGLLFWGAVGTGKTFLALCIANALIDKEIAVAYTSLSEIVNIAKDFDYAKVRLDELLKNKCIILDDLGTERFTSFAEEQIYNFINLCSVKKISLIITTNYTPSILQKAAQCMDDLTYARIYSRILEKCCPIKINEIKRRENNAKKNNDDMLKILKQGDI